jgi:tetratricopeptide (TPR) repeat protein
MLYLIGGHLLLFPFVGIIPAPFMVVTWVSDQHLYAALPAFLAFWIFAFESIKLKHNWIFLLAILGFFSFKTYQSASFYKNEVAFYEESIRSNPTNLPITYNLAFTHLKAGNFKQSLDVLEKFYYLSQYMPELQSRKFYNHLMILYLSLKYPNQDSKK